MNTEEEKFEEVCVALDTGLKGLLFEPPYTPVGNGQIVEVEKKLDKYYSKHKTTPENLLIKDRKAFESAIYANANTYVFMSANTSALNIPGGVPFSGYTISSYMYRGTLIKTVSLS